MAPEIAEEEMDRSVHAFLIVIVLCAALMSMVYLASAVAARMASDGVPRARPALGGHWTPGGPMPVMSHHAGTA